MSQAEMLDRKLELCRRAGKIAAQDRCFLRHWKLRRLMHRIDVLTALGIIVTQ